MNLENPTPPLLPLSPLLDKASVFFRCVEDSNDAIMVTDHLGQLVYVNPAWQRTFGYSAHEAVGQTPRLLRSQHQTDAFYHNMWADIRDPRKGHWKGELINRAKDGSEVRVLLSITPIKADGKSAGYMGIALNTSERHQLQAQILQQDRLASIGLLASGLAHEIGTPLGVIRGRAEYMSMIAPPDEELQSGFQIIINQIDRISKLIYSLLHLARAEQNPSLSYFPLESVLHDVIQLSAAQARRAQVQLEVQVPHDLKVLGAPDQLQQVLLNLMINALQAHQKGASTEKKIKIQAHASTNLIEIQVSDNGPGIRPEVIPRIFEPFFTTKRAGEGTGLGLTLCQKMVESWGGDLRVSSTWGQGTTFSLRWPQNPPH